MKPYITPKAEKRASTVHGGGLFATEKIITGEIVAIKIGHVRNWNQVQEIEARLGDRYFQIEDDFFITPITAEEVPDHVTDINHSCSPNVGISGQVTFIAMRDIVAGEEIFYDYATATCHPYHFVCDCQSPECRKQVTGEDWKELSFQEKYKGYLPPFMVKKIVSLT